MMSSDDLARVRKEYSRHSLDELDVDLNPFVQFQQWFEQAVNAELPEPNAMALATATPDGRPSTRMVLLKGFDERGFVFYTNYEGRKSIDLAANPQAAVLFFWVELERQVRIEGTVEKTSKQESEEYFKTRPLESRLSAWASKQSSIIPSRSFLEQKMSDLEHRYGNREIPLPPFWGGFRIQPQVFEFWQGRENRLHDRVRYMRQGGVWQIERLSP
ncbi:MAG: pyridoxamine 5'-phosphate oxidase [Ignavibacteriales bacterium]|nr:pyridoxamine 5'-phosphate oxidase [Ignavibacteriales bacterium]